MSDLLVLWDVDGTLLNAGGVGGDLYETVFSSMFGHRCEKLAPMAGRTDRAIILDTLEMAGIPEPRRHVDRFIEGLRSHAPHAFEAARRQGRVLPGAAEAIAAIASARVAASTIGFAVPGTAIPGRLVPAARAAIPFPGQATPAPAAGIPLSVIPAPARTATGTAATAEAVPASAFIAATTLPFGTPADQPVVAATITIPPAPAFAPADASQREALLPAQAARPVQAARATQAPRPAQALRPAQAPRPAQHARRRPDAGRVYQSVLTGNVRPLAEVKLSAVGLGHWLDLCIGAYGDDHEVRADFVHLARRRAGGVHSRDFSGAATIVVGDTPLDVEAALAAGARAVGVATGGYSAKALRAAGAHAVLADLTNTAAVLSALLS